MAFVQIMEITSSKYDAIADLDRQWRAATEGKRTLRREIVARDRNNPNRYIVFASSTTTSQPWEFRPPRDTAEFAERALTSSPTNR